MVKITGVALCEAVGWKTYGVPATTEEAGVPSSVSGEGVVVGVPVVGGVPWDAGGVVVLPPEVALEAASAADDVVPTGTDSAQPINVQAMNTTDGNTRPANI